jgi:hypothetical protein
MMRMKGAVRIGVLNPFSTRVKPADAERKYVAESLQTVSIEVEDQ